MYQSPEQIVTVARWPRERTRSLPGRVRGDLIGPWGTNLERRYGAGAVARVRQRLGDEWPLADDLDKTRWVPVAAQLALTEAIIDEHLGGDPLELYPSLLDDTRQGFHRGALLLLRGLGPRRMLKMAPRIHQKVYDVGALDVEVGKHEGTLGFHGAALFGHPTWRLLQLFAQRVLLEIMGVRGATVEGDVAADDRFSVRLRWA